MHQLDDAAANRAAATAEFTKADDAWSAEVRRLWPAEYPDVRYVAKAQGEPGSQLRRLHDWREAAREAFHAAWR